MCGMVWRTDAPAATDDLQAGEAHELGQSFSSDDDGRGGSGLIPSASAVAR